MPRRWLDSWRALVLALLVTCSAATAQAQVVGLDLRSTAFIEPSSTSKMTVITPAALLAVRPVQWLRLNAGYEADIVSGASEAVKAGRLVQNPDIVSAASVHDLRNVVSGGVGLIRDQTALNVSYAYGSENDYRSNAFTVTAGSDFFRRNTQILLSYGRGFDTVCDAANPATRDPTVRNALDSSEGCFKKNDPRRVQRDIALDNFQLAWTQSWTPVFTTQLSLTGALQNGFLGNPYRSVVIGGTGQIAQEHHPENRARGAAGLRLRYYVRGLGTAFGLAARAYIDTWDLRSQTYEIDAERYLVSWMRVQVRGRFYDQSGALFWSDDYTGGEPVSGPRGQYWTGDRELSPLSSYSIGGRAVARLDGGRGRRLAGILMGLRSSVSLDVIKTNLREFTWAGRTPDDTLALVFGLGLGGDF